jgi:hypothetical protein
MTTNEQPKPTVTKATVLGENCGACWRTRLSRGDMPNLQCRVWGWNIASWSLQEEYEDGRDYDVVTNWVRVGSEGEDTPGCSVCPKFEAMG